VASMLVYVQCWRLLEILQGASKKVPLQHPKLDVFFNHPEKPILKLIKEITKVIIKKKKLLKVSGRVMALLM
jgi:hypothetical protein